jgi:predicted transcriptional regulator
MNVHRGFRRFELRPFTDSVRRCVRDHCRTARVGAGLRLESIDMSASNDGYRRVRWTFLTNHARALVCIAEDPQVRLREIAQRIGITERAAQSLVNDLVEAGYVTRKRVGRRNRYEIDGSVPLRHVRDRQLDVGTLLTAFQRKTE